MPVIYSYWCHSFHATDFNCLGWTVSPDSYTLVKGDHAKDITEMDFADWEKHTFSFLMLSTALCCHINLFLNLRLLGQLSKLLLYM